MYLRMHPHRTLRSKGTVRPPLFHVCMVSTSCQRRVLSSGPQRAPVPELVNEWPDGGVAFWSSCPRCPLIPHLLCTHRARCRHGNERGWQGEQPWLPTAFMQQEVHQRCGDGALSWLGQLRPPHYLAASALPAADPALSRTPGSTRHDARAAGMRGGGRCGASRVLRAGGEDRCAGPFRR